MSPVHWLIIIGVLLLLFGAKKLPDLARSIGQSARVFTGEMKDLRQDAPAGTDGSPPPAGTTPSDTAVSRGPATPQTATPTTTPAPQPTAATTEGPDRT